MIPLLARGAKSLVRALALCLFMSVAALAQDASSVQPVEFNPASDFQDISSALRALDLATQDDELNWVGLEIEGGAETATRLLVVSQAHLFGVGVLGAGQGLRDAPAIIRLVGPEGAATGVPHVVTRTHDGWSTELSLPAGEIVRIAIGVLEKDQAPVAALATGDALAARATYETRLRGLLFGAALMLMALLFARGVLSGHGLFFSGFGVAFGLALYIAASATWHAPLFGADSALSANFEFFALLIFLAFGVDFARRAMKLKELSETPNRLALGAISVSVILALAALASTEVAGLAGIYTVIVVFAAGIIIVEGTRQNVEGPKLLLGPWFLFALASVIVGGLGLFAAPRFGNDAVLLVEALLVAASLAATLSIDRLTGPGPAVQGMAPVQERERSHGPEYRFRRALRGARKGVWDWKIHGDRLYLSGGAMALLGFDAQGGEGSEEAFFARIHNEDQNTYRERLRSEVDRGAGHFSYDMRVQLEDGSYRWLRLEAEVSGGTTQTGAHIAGLLSDVDAEHDRGALDASGGLRDHLTGLASRGLFMDRIKHAVESGRVGAAPAVIVMNVDRFEAINDGVGHSGGDTMLIVLARRLEGVLNPGDFAARLGGDEFGVLIEMGAQPDRVLDLTEALRDILSEPLEVEGEEIFPSLSFGVAFVGDGGEFDQSILRCAEVAMYHAKRSGGGRIETFRPEFAKRKGELMSLETGLNRALERREVELLYQPITYVRDGRLAGFEALMRWNHPEHGQMSPDRFIALAEETGAIVPLGRYVIEAAATQLMAWQHVYKRKDPIFVSVNLSARQILHHDIARDVERILGRMTLARRSLVVEVTESMVMENPELAERRLRALSAEGVGLALDDFGTGYSSLSHLARFAFNKLKIDRSFIEAMADDKDTAIIVRAIISLAKDLGQGVVAEGVQTEDQLKTLREMGCELAQGYLFGKPMTAAEAERLIIDDQNKGKRTGETETAQARPASPES